MIEENKYGGTIVKDGNDIVTAYNDSKVRVNSKEWVIILGDDNEPNHDEF